MTNPLPTSPLANVPVNQTIADTCNEMLANTMDANAMLRRIYRLRAAQHAATRQATLEEVWKELRNHPTCEDVATCMRLWLDTQLQEAP